MTRRADVPLRDRAAHLIDRADEVRERTPRAVAELTERAHHLEDEARHRAEELRPVVQIRAWQAFRALAGLLLVVPRAVVRLLGVTQQVADEAADRGSDLLERGREAADALPPARSTRRRRRLRTVLFVAGGFAAGFVSGWLLAQRQEALDEESLYEPHALDPGADMDSPNGSTTRRAAVTD